MNAGRAVAAGLSGGILATFLLWSARDASAGAATLPLLLGGMFGLEPKAAPAVIGGHAVFLALAGAFALGYAWVFEHVAHQADIRVGAVVGLVHAALAGLALVAVGLLHPLLPDLLAVPGMRPGAFGAEGVAAFLVLHVMYGGMVGAIYAPAIVTRRAKAPPRTARSAAPVSPAGTSSPGSPPVRSTTLGTSAGGR